MVNAINLVGHMGMDPETKFLDNGSKLANFSLATTENYKTREGEKKSRTTWHKITAFGPVAEIVERFTSKGALVYVHGKIRNRSYTNREGQEKTITEVVADKVVLLINPKDATYSDL